MPEYRRRLPHFHPADAHLFITWRLWDSLPKGHSRGYPTAGHAFVAHDRTLDRAARGPSWLKNPRIADLVAQSIVVGARERDFYQLDAWVVMPNHVHLLIIPRVGVSVLMRWLKGSTARSANLILGRTGQPFWQDESFDHYLRSQQQIHRTVAYIEENPVSAGLAPSAELWPWSSAGWHLTATQTLPATPHLSCPDPLPQPRRSRR
jgi:putative DNA methylase